MKKQGGSQYTSICLYSCKLAVNCDDLNYVHRDFTRPDLPSGEQADTSASAAGPGSAAAGVPDLTTAIASK